MLSFERIADVHLYRVYVTVNSICIIHIHMNTRRVEIEIERERERERERRETYLIIVASQVRYEPNML